MTSFDVGIMSVIVICFSPCLQVIGDTYSAHDLSEHELLVLGKSGLLLAGPDALRHEAGGSLRTGTRPTLSSSSSARLSEQTR
jgi:hypothetical protein